MTVLFWVLFGLACVVAEALRTYVVSVVPRVHWRPLLHMAQTGLGATALVCAWTHHNALWTLVHAMQWYTLMRSVSVHHASMRYAHALFAWTLSAPHLRAICAWFDAFDFVMLWVVAWDLPRVPWVAVAFVVIRVVAPVWIHASPASFVLSCIQGYMFVYFVPMLQKYAYVQRKPWFG